MGNFEIVEIEDVHIDNLGLDIAIPAAHRTPIGNSFAQGQCAHRELGSAACTLKSLKIHY